MIRFVFNHFSSDFGLARVTVYKTEEKEITEFYLLFETRFSYLNFSFSLLVIFEEILPTFREFSLKAAPLIPVKMYNS